MSSEILRPDELYTSPNRLADHYSRFRVGRRLMLTGHSHQAWPDCAFEGQQAAWLDAAEHVDDKWERAFARADEVRKGFARLLGDAPGDIALGTSTHDLVVRWLSALPLADRPRLVTTDGEFHSIRRQLDRLAELGIEVVKVAASPAGSIAERLLGQVDQGTAAVLVSSVLFESASIVPELGAVLEGCLGVGAELLVDAYHALNVVPFSVSEMGLERAFVVGGGYKYCQLGEGNSFLRVPEGRRMRPVITGWFSEFELLEEAREDGRVSYPQGPGRFAGSTYDPTSHYRAAEVFRFFQRHGLSPQMLREVSQHQVGLLATLFDGLDADPRLIRRDRSVLLSEIGGFLVLRSPRAGEICQSLRERGVLTDVRGEALRLGPAPYLSDEQLALAMEALAETIRALAAC